MLLRSLIALAAAALLGACAVTEPTRNDVSAKSRSRNPKPAMPLHAEAASIMPGRVDRSAVDRVAAARSRIDARHAPGARYDLAADLARRASQPKPKARTIEWTPLGPANAAGRVRALAIDPLEPNIMWLGNPGGGIWRSGDAGDSWVAVGGDLASMVVTCLAIDPIDRNVMYACTGEHFASIVPLRGAGILKSTDRGLTWRLLPATNPAAAGPDFHYVSSIAIHPQATSTLLAATAGGVYRSLDAGATWSRVYDPPGVWLDKLIGVVRFDPRRPSNAIAGGFAGQIAYSRDGGATWTERLLVPSSGFFLRVELTYTAIEERVFASVDDLGSTPAGAIPGRVYRSDDGGDTWTYISHPGHLQMQGGYANSIWAHPTDPDVLVIGGYSTWRSVDGGYTWAEINGPFHPDFEVHPDIHALVSPPSRVVNPPVYAATDGGIFRVRDLRGANASGGSWERLNRGLEITQFYSGASGGDRLAGGTQDVGTLVRFPEWGGEWGTHQSGAYMSGSPPVAVKFEIDPRRTFIGDSGAAVIDPGDPMRMYFSGLYLSLHRSTDGGITTEPMCSGVRDATCGMASQRANFVAPLVADPGDPRRLYAGGFSLWVTDDATADPVAWREVKPPASAMFDHIINAIGVSGADPEIVWVGYNNGGLAVTRDALSPQPRWIEITAAPPRGRPVTSILGDTKDSRTAYVTWGNDVLDGGYAPGNLHATADLGATWTDLAGGLPEVPMHHVVQRPKVPKELYVATTNGVFASHDGGLTWNGSIGPANTIVRQLFWMDPDTLGAATYGNSMWSARLP